MTNENKNIFKKRGALEESFNDEQQLYDLSHGVVTPDELETDLIAQELETEPTSNRRNDPWLDPLMDSTPDADAEFPSLAEEQSADVPIGQIETLAHEAATEFMDLYLPSPEMAKGNSEDEVKKREYVVWAKSLGPLVVDGRVTELFFDPTSEPPYFGVRDSQELNAYMAATQSSELYPAAFIENAVLDEEEKPTTRLQNNGISAVFQKRVQAAKERAEAFKIRAAEQAAEAARVQQAQESAAQIVELRNRRTTEALESAYQMAEQETQRRLERLQVDLPKKGLSWRAQLAMVGIAATTLLFAGLRLASESSPSQEQGNIVVADQDTDMPGRVARSASELPHTLANPPQVRVAENTVATNSQANMPSVDSTPATRDAALIKKIREVQPSANEAVAAAVVTESAPQTAIEAQSDVQSDVQSTREYLNALRTLREKPDFFPDMPLKTQAALQTEIAVDTPGAVLVDIEADLGKRKDIQVGPITIKRGIFGALKIHHDDVPGWIKLDESTAAELVSTYQLDVVTGQAKSTLYGMSAGQFIDMVPDSNAVKKRWQKKHRG